MTKEQMEARYPTIEGINFDLKHERDNIAEIGEEAFIARKKETCWNDGPPLNDAAKMKRIQKVIDMAKAYVDPEEAEALEADARIKAANAANANPKPETPEEKKARLEREKAEKEANK